jgi:hypothetical protein
VPASLRPLIPKLLYGDVILVSNVITPAPWNANFLLSKSQPTFVIGNPTSTVILNLSGAFTASRVPFTSYNSQSMQLSKQALHPAFVRACANVLFYDIFQTLELLFASGMRSFVLWSYMSEAVSQDATRMLRDWAPLYGIQVTSIFTSVATDTLNQTTNAFASRIDTILQSKVIIFQSSVMNAWYNAMLALQSLGVNSSNCLMFNINPQTMNLLPLLVANNPVLASLTGVLQFVETVDYTPVGVSDLCSEMLKAGTSCVDASFSPNFLRIFDSFLAGAAAITISGSSGLPVYDTIRSQNATGLSGSLSYVPLTNERVQSPTILRMNLIQNTTVIPIATSLSDWKWNLTQNYFNLLSRLQLVCPPGTGDVQCKPCASGTFSQNNMCIPCTAMQYCPFGSVNPPLDKYFLDNFASQEPIFPLNVIKLTPSFVLLQVGILWGSILGAICAILVLIGIFARHLQIVGVNSVFRALDILTPKPEPGEMRPEKTCAGL